MALTPGQTSDYKGAAMLLDHLPHATCLLADRGYDANWFRNSLLHKGITPCIPSRKIHKKPVDYDKILYKKRHKVENMFGRIKDWRRIAMRYDQCPTRSFLPYALLAALSSISINEP